MSKQPLNTFEFNKLYNVLNAPQKKAVDAIEGPVMVIAGPGTGKTTILTLRIANILRKTDTAPENILSLTFTESGAYAMRRKLLEIIGPAAYRINIHTFHGFAESIIQEYPDYFPRIIGSAIITEAEQIKIIEKIIQSRKIKVLRPYGDPSYYVKPVLNELHILKRENISPDTLKKSIKQDIQNMELEARKVSIGMAVGKVKNKSNFSKGKSDKNSDSVLEKLKNRNEKNLELAFVYEQYEAELKSQKYYDFDDMLLEIVRVMEKDETFKLMLQENYHYILADEHQDANATQNRILELLSDFHDSPNLFIVGDDKQAIYRFQGASLENFLYFSEKYKNAEIVELEHNYRSHQGILDASHCVIENNPNIPGRVRTKLLSLQIGTKPTFIYEFSTHNDELEYIASLTEQLVKKGEKPEEIAILYRENREAHDISNALRAHGVMHRIESDHNILSDVDSVKIIILARAINDPSNSEFLGQALLLSEMKCDPADVAEVCNLASREKKSLHLMIKELCFRGQNLIGDKKNSASNFKNFKSEGDFKNVKLAVNLNDVKSFINLKEIKIAYEKIVKWSNEAQSLPFPEFLQKLIQETNILASIASAPNSLERLTSLEVFFNRIIKAAQSKKTFFIHDFIEYVSIVSDHGILTKRTYTEYSSGVRLMTAHRAKGLEFNHVFIINSIDGIWGNRTKRNLFTIPIIEHARDIGRIEDERRLFYVAMTRARESVNISYARSNGEKETMPGQFISEINPKLILLEKPIIADKFGLFEKRLKTPHGTPSLSILNPEYIRSKFLSQPLSVTHLNNYLACPWQYFFVNLIRIPQAPNKHQMYGTAIHTALRSFFEAYKDERDFTKKQLIDLFRFNLEKQPLSVDDRLESFEKGKEALEGYFEAYNGLWNRHLLTEYPVKGVEMAINIKPSISGLELVGIGEESLKIQLTGKLDKIDFIDDVNVIVTDWKTAKPKSRNEIEGKTRTADGNYKRQLVFYKLLLDGAKKFVMKYGEIDFIAPNDTGKYKKERFEINDKEVEELRKVIEKTATEILSLTFINSTCDDKECQYCKLGKLLISENNINKSGN
ncbi:MAG: ATP-dependent DNA helicase [Candidatus Paceibacterota bacterium]|jgi:DNA helicase-2/ATP-dependent DNA helicase PcrA